MDNCKKIKELVLTDYTDERLDKASRDKVEEHLSQCVACQNFAREVKSNLIMPFEKVSRQEVPGHLWSKIQQKIQQEQYVKSNVLDLISQWVRGISLPRLVPALGSFVMLSLVTSTVFFNWQIKQAQDQEQGAYVEYMLSSAPVLSQGVGSDLGTPIERYFL